MASAASASRGSIATMRVVAAGAIVLIAGTTLVAMKAMASLNMTFVMIAVMTLPLAMAVVAWPELSTLAVVFILFTNAADVAVTFHGVPYIVAASFPGLLCVPLFYYLIARREPLIFTPVLPLICTFAVIQFVGTLFSKDVSLAFPGLLSFLFEGLAIYVLLTNAIRTPQVMRQVIWVLLVAGLFIGALSLFQQVTRTFQNNYGGFAQMTSRGFEDLSGPEAMRQFRLGGPIGEQNRYAQIMLMLLPLGFFRCWSERSRWMRGLACLASALVAVAIVLTFSRGAAIAAVALILVMWYMRFISVRQLGLLGLGAILIALAFPAFLDRLATLAPLMNSAARLDVGGDDVDGSVKGRETAMVTAAMVCADHPLIGVGPNMFRFHYMDYARTIGPRFQEGNWQAHNLYLGIAADTGLLGLSCFLAIIFVTVRNLLRMYHRWKDTEPELARYAAGLMLAILAYLITGMGLHFAFVRYFWLFMALAGSLSVMDEHARRRHASADQLGQIEESN